MHLRIKIASALKKAEDLGYKVDYVVVHSNEIYNICKEANEYTIRGVKIIADNRHLTNNNHFILLKTLKA